MQRKEVSNWIVISLSAEQALIDGDFEHLDVLLNRRDELLTDWEKAGLQFTERELKQMREVSEKLSGTMSIQKDRIGSEIQATKNRSVALKAYRSAS